jgi:hypothetical protein
MQMLFQPTRNEVREFFCGAWHKYEHRLILTSAEEMACQIIHCHPEYHDLLRDLEQAKQKNWLPEDGIMNPFLHLSLHLAVCEQLSIDQPQGIYALYEQQIQRGQDPHELLHDFIEALGEWMWALQKQGINASSDHYLELIKKKLCQ